MTMEFCKKCGAIMRPAKDDKTIIECSCGNRKTITHAVMKEKMAAHKELDVIHDTINPLAVYPHKCKKCGFDKAQLISKGVWYTDEDEVIEYVCGRCGLHEKASEGSKIM